MSGNVSEWVQDFFSPHWYRTSPERNPVNNKGSRRIVKGGTWYLDANHFLRISRRASLTPTDWKYNRGMRCVYAP